MNIRLGDTHTVRWTTADPTTGAAANASAQTVNVFEESTDTPIVTPTPTNVSTGHYRADLVCTAGNGFEAGKVYSVEVEATIGGVACKGVVGWFKVSTRAMDDLAYPATTGRSLAVESDGMVYADLREWLGTAPLALSSQRVQTLVGAFTAGVIDAAAIGTGAIDADAIAAGAITSSEAPALANLDAAVSTRALETGGNLATVLSRIIGTLAAGTHNPQSGDAYARIGATGSGLTSLAAAADVATLLGRIIGTLATGTHQPQTGDAYARIGAAGAGLTALGDARVANLDAAISTRGTADPGDAMTLTAGERTAVSDAVGSRTADGALSWDQMQKLVLAFVAGLTDGGGTTTVHFYRQDGVTAALTMTVDANGNRSVVVKDVT